MHIGRWTAGILAALVAATPAASQTLFADTVIEYRKSGRGPLPEPYGGMGPRGEPFPLRDLSFALDRNPMSAVSLPRGASLALGFSGGFIFDGPGPDIFISELGASKELADIFISSDFGRSWQFLGRADGGTVTTFDLARIGFRGRVNAVKIVGLDMKGSYPGFDIAYVEGLKGSIRREPQQVPPGLTATGRPAPDSSAAERARQEAQARARAEQRRRERQAAERARQEAARQEAARQEAARQEAARQEAARQQQGGSGGSLIDLMGRDD